MSVPGSKKSLILLNLVCFVGLLALNGLSNIKSPLFPRNISNVSSEFPTQITPSGPTFAIWGFIYTFQTAWVLYTLTLICRPKAADIVPATLYVAFSASCVCNVCWVLVWVREMFGLSLALLAGTVIALATSVGTTSKSLHDYLKREKQPSVADVWCVRILLQNGIIFYNAWVLIATCINLVVSLHYQLGFDASKSATAALAVLLCVTVFWFILENFVLQDYTRYVFAEYIVLIVGLSGVIKAHWTGGQGNQTFVLVCLIVSALFFVARIALIIVQEKKSSKKENIVEFKMPATA